MPHSLTATIILSYSPADSRASSCSFLHILYVHFVHLKTTAFDRRKIVEKLVPFHSFVHCIAHVSHHTSNIRLSALRYDLSLAKAQSAIELQHSQDRIRKLHSQCGRRKLLPLYEAILLFSLIKDSHTNTLRCAVLLDFSSVAI